MDVADGIDGLDHVAAGFERLDHRLTVHCVCRIKDVVLEPHLMPTAISCAEAGLGTAILPSSGVPSTLPPSLVCLDLVDPVVRRDLSLITLAQTPLSPSTKALYVATTGWAGVTNMAIRFSPDTLIHKFDISDSAITTFPRRSAADGAFIEWSD